MCFAYSHTFTQKIIPVVYKINDVHACLRVTIRICVKCVHFCKR